MAPLPYFHLRFFSPSEKETEICDRIVTNTAGLVARHLNKRFSLPISLVLSRLGVKPNNITFFNMFVGLLSGIFAAVGTPTSILWGGILFQAASVLDGVDGEVAKLTDKATQAGQWLDTLSDNMTLVVFLVGLTYGLYQTTESPFILLAGELAFISIVILIAIMIIFLRKNTDSGSFVTYDKEFVHKIAMEEKGFLPKFIKYGRHLLKKDSFALLFFLLTLIQLPAAIIYLTAFAATAGWVLMVYFNVKKKFFRHESL
ncbi:MAG: CDP-alcohol phosphatidyltransferase family protein [bacterium]|nr:CDP-alcohol phosphatidyltransferase family protein [bacterium]